MTGTVAGGIAVVGWQMLVNRAGGALLVNGVQVDGAMDGRWKVAGE
jgi:hypothetical protein